MRITSLAFTALILLGQRLVAQGPGGPNADNNTEQFTATVQVRAFDLRGVHLGIPTVRLFESNEGRDLSGAFRAGVANHIPFGVYKIESYISGFYPEVRYVSVYRQQVTVVVGLPFGSEVMTLPVPPNLHGRVIGFIPKGKNTFVKLVSIYSNESLESSIDVDGGFNFGIPKDGRYVLWVINEDGILASRMVTSPYSGPALEIQTGTGVVPR